jgi:hypothetical protein
VRPLLGLGEDGLLHLLDALLDTASHHGYDDGIIYGLMKFDGIMPRRERRKGREGKGKGSFLLLGADDVFELVDVLLDVLQLRHVHRRFLL